METLAFLKSCGLLHWVVAFFGIISLLLVRLIRVNEFSMRKWINENLIGLIWSVFFLTLTVTLTYEYFPQYRLLEAFFTGFAGTYLIFRLLKEPKVKSTSNPKKKHNH